MIRFANRLLSENRPRTERKPGYVIVVPWDLNHVGGVNEVALNLYRQILNGGEFEPRILVTRWKAFRPIETECDGRPTAYLRLWSPVGHESGLFGLAKWFLASPVLLFEVAMFARRHRVAVFHFHYPSCSAFPIALLRCLRLFRGSLLLTFHGLDLMQVIRASRIDRAEWRFVLRWTTAVTACSEAFARDVREALSEMHAPVQAIQNGLDIAHLLGTVDRTSPLPDGILNRDYILSIATFERKKGLDILLQAFAEVRRGHPGLALVLVGRASSAVPELHELAQALGIAADVFFLTDVPHTRVGLFLERARAFCLPSRAEPFGIVLLEAGAYRLPVVASRVGGIPEIVEDGKSGLLVPAEDVGALADALARVLDDPDLSQLLGANLYSRVAYQFSWERAYKTYRDLLPGPRTVPQSVAPSLE